LASPTTSTYKRIGAKRAVLHVLRRLHGAGHQALLAGGCVRDMLLGKVPDDYDVATSARPDDVVALFSRTITVGAQFGVVVVLVGGRQVEVATFRSEDCYSNGRRPNNVVFTDARRDAERRDFTINGMFFDPLKNEVIDYVGGRKDLAQGVIRAIGKPEERFQEDHLRMLRAIRFACRFDFPIARGTWQAIRKQAGRITRISAERIAAELERILVDPHRPRGMKLALQSGLLGPIFPSLEFDQLRFGISVLEELPKRTSFALALAAFLAAGNKENAAEACRRLKTSTELRRQVTWLVTQRPELLQQIPLSRGRLKKWLAEPLFGPLLELLACYVKATGVGRGELRTLRRQIKELGDEPIAPPRFLDGHDLIRLGVKPGPRLGQLLEEVCLAQLENEVATRSQACTWVQQRLNHLEE